MFKSTLLCLAFGTLALAAACDDEDTLPGLGDGGTTLADGGARSDGTPRTDGPVISRPDAAAPTVADAAVPRPDAAAPSDGPAVVSPPPACSSPCLTKLWNAMQPCVSMGACVESQSASALNTCHGNGVKTSFSTDFVLSTYKPGGALCHSVSIDPATSSGSIKDATGLLLGTFTVNAANQTIFTCDGQEYNLTSIDCGFSGGTDGEQECMPGACTIP